MWAILAEIWAILAAAKIDFLLRDNSIHTHFCTSHNVVVYHIAGLCICQYNHLKYISYVIYIPFITILLHK